MFLVTNLDPENECDLWVTGNTKGLGGLLHNCVERGNKQSNKRSMAGTITGQTKRERQRKAKRQPARRNRRKGREL